MFSILARTLNSRGNDFTNIREKFSRTFQNLQYCHSFFQLWETTPPAPGSNKDSELKYIDLDHDDSLEQPMRSPVGANSSLQPTEYHEIDFVKTDALKTVRETTTKERQKQADS